ncbi:DUF6879 family protein [Glycomyces tarimensis]
MPEPLNGAVGVRMDLDAYYADFKRHFWRSREFWKLERAQTFAEPGDASWEAFNSGDWDESMRLLEERRPDLTDYHDEARAAGVSTHRIRIVEKPISPYLQWELNLLKIRDETGGPIRVLDASEIAELETDGPLPEIYTMDERVMFEAVYDHNGVLECALKYTDPALIAHSRDFIRGLYERGTPIARYFPDNVRHLPPAHPDRRLRDGYLEQVGRPGPIRS